MTKFININQDHSVAMMGLTKEEMEFLEDFFKNDKSLDFINVVYSKLKESKKLSNVVIIPESTGTWGKIYIIQKIIS